LEVHEVDALLVIGGWNAYQAAHLLYSERERYPKFRMPVICIPASIDNNLPGSELAIGADTALNAIVEAVDRIKLSASATTRAFVVETMGRFCGYLALMGGLAAGAERVYLHETGITLDQLSKDVHWLDDSFSHGRRFFLAMRNEMANEHYTTDFIARILEEEGGDLYDVRTAVLGHLQQGGSPTPFDRLLATRLVSRGLDLISTELGNGTDESYYVGLVESKVTSSPMSQMMAEMDRDFRRPKKQWWMELREVVSAVSDAPR
jgi:6-phosphofructokinase 1